MLMLDIYTQKLALNFSGDKEAAAAAIKAQALQDPDSIQEMGLQGAFKTCTNLLMSGSTAGPVQETAIWLLSQLVTRCWSQHSREAEPEEICGTQYILNNGGITVMSAALDSSSTYVQSHAAWILARMAECPNISAKIMASSAPKRLLAPSVSSEYRDHAFCQIEGLCGSWSHS